LLKRIYSLPFIIAINRKVGLKKAPSCLNFTASIIKNLPVHVIFKELLRGKFFTHQETFAQLFCIFASIFFSNLFFIIYTS